MAHIDGARRTPSHYPREPDSQSTVDEAGQRGPWLPGIEAFASQPCYLPDSTHGSLHQSLIHQVHPHGLMKRKLEELLICFGLYRGHVALMDQVMESML